MPRKVRKQLYLDVHHERMLKRRSRQKGVTEAEIVREALDREEAYGAGLGGARGRVRDAAAAGRVLKFIKSLAQRRRKAPAGRGWTRESLYEGRLGRWRKS